MSIAFEIMFLMRLRFGKTGKKEESLISNSEIISVAWTTWVPVLNLPIRSPVTWKIYAQELDFHIYRMHIIILELALQSYFED